MTTHTDLIARLLEMAGRLRLEAADAIESLEQQVAALTSAVKDAEVVCDSYAAENQRLSDEKDALTKERDELEISNAFAHGEWRAVKDQLAAMTKERDAFCKVAEHRFEYLQIARNELVSAQAREAKLRELWEVVEKEYFARLKEQDEEAAKFEAEKDMYGWNFHKGLRGGLVEFHIYMTKIVKALALPTDDSALMERLKQERDRCALLLDNASGKGSIISCVSAAAAIRSMK